MYLFQNYCYLPAFVLTVVLKIFKMFISGVQINWRFKCFLFKVMLFLLLFLLFIICIHLFISHFEQYVHIVPGSHVILE